jgi:hypothetical protein
MRIQWLATIAAVLMGAGATQAQPAKQTEPTVELRLRSINDLLDKGEFIGGLAGQEEVVKGVKALLKALTKEKTGLEGIDPKRPFGLYGSLSADVVNSPIILMIPIADQERFLKMLKDRLDNVPEKAEEGTLKAFVPFVNELYLRFANDYLYIGRTVKDLDPKTLISPKTFFAKDDGAIGSLIVRLDRIPDEVKTFILGQVELTTAEQRKKNGEKENPAEKAFLDWFGDGLTGGLKTFFEDSKELNIRVFVDEKADELSAELTLTAKQGSTLAKNFSAFAGKSSLPAAIVSGKQSAIRASTKVGLTPELKKRFAKVVDDVSAELEKKADPNAKAIVKQALETLAPTFKAADLDAAIAFNGPDAKGRHTLILAGAVKNGKDIERLLKELALSAGGVADFDFDVEKIGEFSLHKITLNDGPPELEKIFGTKTFWMAISDSHIALSIEPDGATIRAGLKSKAVVVPVLSVEVAVAKLVPLIAKDLKEDELKAIMKDAFGEGGSAGKDTVTVTITAGEQLTVKAKVKGKAIRVLFGVNQLKNK